MAKGSKRSSRHVKEEDSQPKKSRFTDEEVAKKLNANCKIFFEDSDEPLFVNRHLLAMYSTVFRTMFEGDFKEKDAEELKIKDMAKEDFLEFLHCLHLPPMPITGANFQAVLMVADRYDCELLIEECKKFAETAAKDAKTLQECKNIIEKADRHGWDGVMSTLFHVMHQKGLAFLVELLEEDWLKTLKSTTRARIFEEVNKLAKQKPGSSGRIIPKHATVETSESSESSESSDSDEDCNVIAKRPLAREVNHVRFESSDDD